jgi:hypothetical protein
MQLREAAIVADREAHLTHRRTGWISVGKRVGREVRHDLADGTGERLEQDTLVSIDAERKRRAAYCISRIRCRSRTVSGSKPSGTAG